MFEKKPASKAGFFVSEGLIAAEAALAIGEMNILALDAEFYRDLEIQHEDGSRLTCLVKVLREMAKSDEKLTNVLRSFSLP